MRLTAHAYPAQQEHFLASGFDAVMSVRHPYIYDPGIQHEPLRNGEGVWGRGSFHFVSLFLFKVFLLWVLLRASVMGVPLVQGASAPAGHSLMAHKNTVLSDHCPKRSLLQKAVIFSNTDPG